MVDESIREQRRQKRKQKHISKRKGRFDYRTGRTGERNRKEIGAMFFIAAKDVESIN